VTMGYLVLLTSHPSFISSFSHATTRIAVRSKERLFIMLPPPLFSSCFPASSAPSPLSIPVVWYVLAIEIITNGCSYRRVVMRGFLYISVCMQLIPLFDPFPFLPSWADGYIGSSRPHHVHVCIITGSPPFLVWTEHSSLLPLVIYFVVEIALLLAPLTVTILFTFVFVCRLQPMYFCASLVKVRWLSPFR
jgi:hypothetical protein